MLSLYACGNSQETTITPKAATPQAKKVAQKPAQARTTTIRSTSNTRPKSQINQAYPYDIDLKKADGSIVNSSEVLAKNGKPTMVLFWLTTCFPCKMELAAVQKKYASWKEQADFNMVVISTDFSKNYPRFVDMVNKSGWEWETYNDVNREFRNVIPGQLNGLPQSFVFNADGEIVYHKRKYSTGDEDKLFGEVLKLVK